VQQADADRFVINVLPIIASFVDALDETILPAELGLA
jgi:hypothetical protein